MRAKNVPAHLEQAGTGGVEKEVDRFGFDHPALAPEGERVHSVQPRFVATAQQTLELGYDARASRTRTFHFCHAAFEERFVELRHGSNPLQPNNNIAGDAARRHSADGNSRYTRRWLRSAADWTCAGVCRPGRSQLCLAAKWGAHGRTLFVCSG
jgi:hypothetical protein